MWVEQRCPPHPVSTPRFQLRQLWWGLPGLPVQQLWPLRPLPQPLCCQGLGKEARTHVKSCGFLLKKLLPYLGLSCAPLKQPLWGRVWKLWSCFWLLSGFDAAILNRKAGEQVKAVAHCCSFHPHTQTAWICFDESVQTNTLKCSQHHFAARF